MSSLRYKQPTDFELLQSEELPDDFLSEKEIEKYLKPSGLLLPINQPLVKKLRPFGCRLINEKMGGAIGEKHCRETWFSLPHVQFTTEKYPIRSLCSVRIGDELITEPKVSNGSFKYGTFTLDDGYQSDLKKLACSSDPTITIEYLAGYRYFPVEGERDEEQLVIPNSVKETMLETIKYFYFNAVAHTIGFNPEYLKNLEDFEGGFPSFGAGLNGYRRQ